MSVCLSVCSSELSSSAPTRQIFIKYEFIVFFENLSRKFQVSLLSDNNNRRFTCRLYSYDSILLSCPCNEKWVRQNLQRKSNHTFYVPQVTIFLEIPTVTEIMWTNMVEGNRPQMTVFHMGMCCLRRRSWKANIFRVLSLASV